MNDQIGPEAAGPADSDMQYMADSGPQAGARLDSHRSVRGHEVYACERALQMLLGSTLAAFGGLYSAPARPSLGFTIRPGKRSSRFARPSTA